MSEQFSKMVMISNSERGPKKVCVVAVFLNIGKGKNLTCKQGISESFKDQLHADK